VIKVGSIFQVKRTCYKVLSIENKGKYNISTITDSGKRYAVPSSFLMDGTDVTSNKMIQSRFSNAKSVMASYLND